METTTTVEKTCDSECNKPPTENNTREIPHYDKHRFLFWEFQTPLKWINIILISFVHIMALYYLLTRNHFREPGMIIYSFILAHIGGFGVTGGVHRYFTHRSYKAKLPLRIILLFCFTLSGQNSVKAWVMDHRVHHKFSDTDADPHNVNRGFFFSHVGWLMMRKHPEVIRKGKQIDISDLFEDPLVVFHEKYFMWLKMFIAYIIPVFIPPYLYGESWSNSIGAVWFIKTVIVLNGTWSVNSFAHLWGCKPYNKKIFPVQNLFVSAFALGEGYHNYHHTFPWDYRTSEFGSKINLTATLLDFFHTIGWAYDMKAPSLDVVRKVAEKQGDGSFFNTGQEFSVEDVKKLM